MVSNAKDAFAIISAHCDPINELDFSLVFDMFFGGIIKKSSPFVGGCGDKRRTKHENMFSLMFPHLKQQVVFGTGKNGYTEYLSKKFTADFYDEINKTIYEIDGPNHFSERKKLKDKIPSDIQMLRLNRC